MWNCIRNFMRDEGGTTAIEYAMIAALISVGIITAISDISSTMSTNYFDLIGSMR
jgi:pilus assembly protein Flp/PilA